MRLLFFFWLTTVATPAAEFFEWRALPPLPEPLGVAGAFSGVVDGQLLVAGGAHFPVSPFRGGTKVWIADAYLLAPGAEAWRAAGSLPSGLAYGASIQLPDSVLFFGGSDSLRHYPYARKASIVDGRLQVTQLPPMPGPLANFAAALVDGIVYVAGGQETPDARSASRRVWAASATELVDPVSIPVWRELEPIPGPGRILPVAAGQDGAFYLFSGAELVEDPTVGVTREFLTDAYRYRPATGWEQVASPPQPLVAAPAAPWGPAHIVVLGGDDGARFAENDRLADNHPGFPRDIWAYHTITDSWARVGEAPFGRVTTTAIPWQGGLVAPSGEDRPGHRSPQVFFGAPVERRTGFRIADYCTLTLYLGGLIAVGLYFSKRGRTTEDFFLAGRRVPWWAAGLSIYGTQLSSISFIAIPAKVYATDWVYLLVQFSIILVAFPTVWLYLPFFRRAPLTTAYEYLEHRFNLPVRLFASASFIFFQIGRMAIVLYLPAIALATVTGLGVYSCILIMGVLATIYTYLGGIEAVIWTDVLQVFVLLGGAGLSLAIILSQIDGGLAGLLEAGQANNKLHVFNWTWDWTTTAVWVVLVGNFFNNLVPYTSDQAVVQRYLTTKDERSAACSIWTNAVMLVPSTLMLFTLGTALWLFYRTRPELLRPDLAADSIFPLFMAQQLPLGLAGLVIAGVFAASMSTLDSSLNSVATAVTTDFYGRFRPQTTDARKLRLARLLTALLGILATASAIYLASSRVASMWDAFQAIMGLFGGALAGLFALGIFSRRANGTGALLGALFSIVTLAWVQQKTDLHFFLYGMIGVLSCIVVGYLLSWALPRPPRDLAGLTVYDRRR